MRRCGAAPAAARNLSVTLALARESDLISARRRGAGPLSGEPMELARGQVTDRPWGMTLAALGARHATGQLTLRAEGKQYCIVFDHGAVVGATSPLASDAAARVALIHHMIAPTQVGDLTRRIIAAPGREEIEVLAEAARLSLEQTLRLRRKVIEQRAARTFSVDAGEFVLDSIVAIPILTGFAIDARSVIYHGARVNLSQQRLSEELRQLGQIFVLRPEAIGQLPYFGFTELERPILEALCAGTSVAELEARYRDIDPRTMQAVIYALASCSLCNSGTPLAAQGGGGGGGEAAAPRDFAVGGRHGPDAAPSDVYSRGRAGRDVFVARGAVSEPRTAPRQTPPVGTPVTPPPPPAPPRTGASAWPPHPPDAAPRAPARAPTAAPDETGVRRAGRSTVVRTPPAGVSAEPGPGAAPSAAPVIGRAMTQNTGPVVGRAPTPVGPPVTGRAPTPVGPPVTGRTPTPVSPPATGRTPTGNGPPAPGRTATTRAVPPDRPPDRPTAPPVARTRSTSPTGPAPIVARTQSTSLSGPTRISSTVAAVSAPDGADPSFAVPDPAAAAREAFKRGQSRLRVENLEDAILDLERAALLAPHEVDYTAMLAWARFCQATDKQALAQPTRDALGRAIRKSPTPDVARFYLGRVERMLGRDREALRHFQLVLEAQPKHADAAAEVRAIEARVAQAAAKESGVFGRKR